MGVDRALTEVPAHEPIETFRVGQQLPQRPFVKLACAPHPLLGRELRRKMPHQAIAPGKLF